MTRIALAPCSPFSVSKELMVESVLLARELGVRLHTHIAETLDEEAYCINTFGCRPLELLEQMDWLGPDVWLAHCVHLDDTDITSLAPRERASAIARHRTCCSRRAWPGLAICWHRLFRVGLGVDGSASNDSGYFAGEVKQALLMARVRDGVEALSARDALRLATRGGAACLGRNDIGEIAPGKCADICLFRLDDLPHAGAQRDPGRGIRLVWTYPGGRGHHQWAPGGARVFAMHRGRVRYGAEAQPILETSTVAGRYSVGNSHCIRVQLSSLRAPFIHLKLSFDTRPSVP